MCGKEFKTRLELNKFCSPGCKDIWLKQAVHPKREAENVNAPDKKPTEKPLRENPDPGDNVTEGDPEKEAAVKVGGEIPKPAPFSPANTQKGHHEVVQN